MKRIKSIVISTALLVLGAVPATSFAQVAFQAADIQNFSDGTVTTGAMTLSRSAGSVQLRGSMAGLDKKTVYSVWWIIFNNPNGCVGGGEGVCTGADVYPGGPADAGVINASGFVTGTDGTGYFVGELETGPAPSGMPCCFGQLNDSVSAEIHIVVQTHGPGVPGTFATEMTNPTGIDQFFAIFLSPAL
ncbi:MAG: hypothetical protein OER91_04370 [Gammaproteobacteria bacterium]|nr:hypothetical protein [Gammaproteobacteria bacterium]